MTRTKKVNDTLTSLALSTELTLGQVNYSTTSRTTSTPTKGSSTTHITPAEASEAPTEVPSESTSEIFMPVHTLKFMPIDETNYPDDEYSTGTLPHPLQTPGGNYPKVYVPPPEVRIPGIMSDGIGANGAVGGSRSGPSDSEVRNGDSYRVPSPPVVSLGTVTVRAEEIALVMVVLMLWAGAITLFINRWGKLRMLEPYQPAYTAPSPPPRPPPPPVGPCINIQSTSDLTLCEGGAVGGRYDWGACDMYGRGSLASGYLGLSRSPSALSIKNLDPQRKVKSAVDLVSLVMQEKMASNYHLAATNV